MENKIQRIVSTLFAFFCLLCLSSALAEDKGKLEISGSVFENMGKTPLQGSMVKLFDTQGNVLDSMKSGGSTMYGNVVKKGLSIILQYHV